MHWWFGNSFIILFEKNKQSILTVEEKRIYCDVCNNKCKKGLNGNNPNDCMENNMENKIE